MLLLILFVAVISIFELRGKLALDHVSLQHILAVVIGAAVFTLEGSIAIKNIYEVNDI